jgi:hypothetical protein
MANKFVLVPDDIYRGLTTSSSSGNINLDFARRRLDELKRARLTPTAKNLLYNQELRRYLHLRSQQENKPIKVEMVATPSGAIITNNPAPPASLIAGDEGEDQDDDLFSYHSLPQYIPPFNAHSVPTISPSISVPSQRGRDDSFSTEAPGPSARKRRADDDENGQSTKRVRSAPRAAAAERQSTSRRRRRPKQRYTVDPPLPPPRESPPVVEPVPFAEEEEGLEVPMPQPVSPSPPAPPPANRHSASSKKKGRKVPLIANRDQQARRRRREAARHKRVAASSATPELSLEPSTSAAAYAQAPAVAVDDERRGKKRPTPQTLAPPAFMYAKRIKRNPPPIRRRRADMGTPPPYKIFRPTLW